MILLHTQFTAVIKGTQQGMVTHAIGEVEEEDHSSWPLQPGLATQPAWVSLGYVVRTCSQATLGLCIFILLPLEKKHCLQKNNSGLFSFESMARI
jgi:hypothetical protein